MEWNGKSKRSGRKEKIWFLLNIIKRKERKKKYFYEIYSEHDREISRKKM
jgi:hypothetical protein